MGNLTLHAEKELKWAGYSPDADDPLDRGIYQSTMAIVSRFEGVGHSGSSAAFHTAMIERLLQFKPLGPITNHPDEWLEVSDFMGPGSKGVWQNRRDSRMFSEDGGKTYYSVDELRHGWKRRLFGRRGKTYVAAKGAN